MKNSINTWASFALRFIYRSGNAVITIWKLKRNFDPHYMWNIFAGKFLIVLHCRYN